MKKLPAILLLTLVLLPVIWNGVSFFHFIVEHTHTFCGNDADHEHSSTHDCLNIYHLTEYQDHEQILVKTEFFELKQYITNYPTLNIPILLSTSSAVKFESSFLYGKILTDGIFRPPIA
ncbi:MAG: hypothetical protein ACI9XO_001044 [Paraglaciecola sp.]|jgi:hypothetical protein